MLDARRGVLWLSLAALAVAAGCLGGPTDLETEPAEVEHPVNASPTRPVFEDVTRTQHVVQDEVQGEETEETWVDVYRPTEQDAAPVILVFTPYQSFSDASAVTGSAAEADPTTDPDERPYDPQLVDFFVPRGYAVAFADVRGNHNSGGCIDQSGPDQWRDGYALVEWLADREWSNGKVGMHGLSYDGETQLTTALLNPPSLETIVPAASVDSQYKYLHYQGVPYELQGAGTMAGYLAISAIPGTHPNAAQSYPERLTCQPENLQAALDVSGDWNGYWEDRAYHKLAERSNVSMLRVHGFQDWNVKPDHVDPSTNAWGGEPTRALYGQWNHAFPDREDWWGQGGILHRWYDAFLADRDTGIEDALPPVLAEDTQGDWHMLDSFPPEDADTLELHLSGELELARNASEEASATIRDYPRGGQGTGLDPTTESAVARASETAGPPAELVFTSQPLEKELAFAGRPTVTFNATTSAESTHWVAHLEVEDGDAWTWINRGYQDTRHREGLDDPQPLEPGEAYEASIEMFPQLDVVEEGQRLRLVLTNQDTWVHQDTTYADSTVQLGPEATLELPLLPDDAQPLGVENVTERGATR